MKNPILLALAAVAAFFIAKKFAGGKPGGAEGSDPPDPGTTTPPVDTGAPSVGEQSFSDALALVAKRLGKDIARKVERVYRLETANFSSGGYKATKSPGQKAFSAQYPWGWPKRGTVPGDYLPPVTMRDNGEAADALWVAYKELPVAVGVLGDFIKAHGGNAARWNTTDPEGQAVYQAKLDKIPTPIADSL